MYNDSLVLMFNFDNVSSLGENNTRVVDLSGYGNNGTGTNFKGSEFIDNGKYGGGIFIDGTGSYLNCGNDASLSPALFTISAWIKRNTSDSSEDHIITKGVNRQFYVRDNILHFQYATGDQRIQGQGTIEASKWYHVAFTYDGVDGKIYINGILDKNQTQAITTNSNNVVIGISQTYDSNFNFNGWIDEVRIWNRSLTATEIYLQYISNLNKFDTDKWMLYVNQSKNSTDGLDEGTYTYYAFAKDTSGTENFTDLRTITIDTTVPGITLFAPDNNNVTNNTYIKFNWSVMDNFDSELLCNITINGVVNQSNIDSLNGSFTNVSVTGFNDGVYYWNVTCIDNATNANTSATRNFTIVVYDIVSPTVRLNSPSNDSKLSVFNISFEFTPYDNSTIFNATLYANFSGDFIAEEGNQTALTSGVQAKINVTDLDEGSYIWNVLVCDVSNLG